jgi:hypothetical protein
LPIITLNVDKYRRGEVLNIGKCNEKLKGMVWAKLITNSGEKLLSMNEDHEITFNSAWCKSINDGRGVNIKTTVNPTCGHIIKNTGCNLKKITWARIESDLTPIGLDINRKYVVGRCSKEFPGMQWARLVTNGGSSNLDLNFDNEIRFNVIPCGIDWLGAKVTKHSECLPQQEDQNDEREIENTF